jgi:hypothetical protein
MLFDQTDLFPHFAPLAKKGRRRDEGTKDEVRRTIAICMRASRHTARRRDSGAPARPAARVTSTCGARAASCSGVSSTRRRDRSSWSPRIRCQRRGPSSATPARCFRATATRGRDAHHLRRARHRVRRRGVRWQPHWAKPASASCCSRRAATTRRTSSTSGNGTPPSSRAAAPGSTIDDIVVRGGECVGGGTTVNYALAMDPVEGVWAGAGRAD